MENKIEGKIENNKPSGEVSEEQVLGIMDKIATANDSRTINRQYNEDGQITLWEIKVSVAKGATKIYTYQKNLITKESLWFILVITMRSVILPGLK